MPAGPGARRRAFTRLELAVVLATLALLACLAFPGLANGKPRSERVICVNNLRQIGQGFQMWATDHGGLPPCRDYARQMAPGIYDPDGGTRGHPLDSQVWFQFSWVSNQLGSPKILACPADPLVRPAQDWSANANMGFMHPALRSEAISFFLGLHALDDYPRSILAGDRNLSVTSIGGTCWSGIRNPQTINPSFPTLAWVNDIHGPSGNLLLTSGVVLQLATPALRPALIEAGPPEGVLHFLFPRPPYLAQ